MNEEKISYYRIHLDCGHTIPYKLSEQTYKLLEQTPRNKGYPPKILSTPKRCPYCDNWKSVNEIHQLTEEFYKGYKRGSDEIIYKVALERLKKIVNEEE